MISSAAPGHSIIIGTCRHSHNITINRLVQIHIDDLFTEIVGDYIGQFAQSGVVGNVEDVGLHPCDLEELDVVDV